MQLKRWDDFMVPSLYKNPDDLEHGREKVTTRLEGFTFTCLKRNKRTTVNES